MNPYVEMYRHCDIIILCCGQGAWEDEMIYSTHRMQNYWRIRIFQLGLIDYYLDDNHDWDWWQIQLPYFINHIL